MSGSLVVEFRSISVLADLDVGGNSHTESPILAMPGQLASGIWPMLYKEGR